MKTSRKYYQVYEEITDVKFDGIKKTIYTLRAKILNALAPNELAEYRPNKKDGYDYFEDAIKVKNPEAEIKFGISRYDKVYVQTSVTDKTTLEDLHRKVINALRAFFSEEVKIQVNRGEE